MSLISLYAGFFTTFFVILIAYEWKIRAKVENYTEKLENKAKLTGNNFTEVCKNHRKKYTTEFTVALLSDSIIIALVSYLACLILRYYQAIPVFYTQLLFFSVTLFSLIAFFGFRYYVPLEKLE